MKIVKTLKLISSGLLLSATIVACFTFVSCASVQRVQTASGMPEVTINAKPDRIKVALMSVMANNGYALMRDTEYSLGFGKTMDTGQELLTRVALGNAYSSQPKVLVEYSLIPQGNMTRVISHTAIDMQNPFGGQQGMSLDNGKAGQQVQAMLEQLASRLG